MFIEIGKELSPRTRAQFNANAPLALMGLAGDITGCYLLAILGKGKNRPMAKRPGPTIAIGNSAPIASR
jgi:hypothetical protein